MGWASIITKGVQSRGREQNRGVRYDQSYTGSYIMIPGYTHQFAARLQKVTRERENSKEVEWTKRYHVPSILGRETEARVHLMNKAKIRG